MLAAPIARSGVNPLPEPLIETLEACFVEEVGVAILKGTVQPSLQGIHYALGEVLVERLPRNLEVLEQRQGGLAEQKQQFPSPHGQLDVRDRIVRGGDEPR